MTHSVPLPGRPTLQMTPDRIFAVVGAASAFLSVAAGAFGAHLLRSRLVPDLQAVFETGARYQMYHAIGLFAVAWVYSRWPSTEAQVAGWFFIGGTLIFSGSLYVLSLTGIRGWGAVTPIGGLCFLTGWAALLWGIVGHR